MISTKVINTLYFGFVFFLMYLPLRLREKFYIDLGAYLINSIRFHVFINSVKSIVIFALGAYIYGFIYKIYTNYSNPRCIIIPLVVLCPAVIVCFNSCDEINILASFVIIISACLISYCMSFCGIMLANYFK